MTVFAAVSTIHDGGQQRTTLSLVTQATAMHCYSNWDGTQRKRADCLRE